MGQLAHRPNAAQRAVHIVTRTAAGSWLFARTLHQLDRPVLRLSRGRYSVTSTLTGLPIVMVSTIGAKSGQLRHLPLVVIPDGENVILIASNFGQKRHPAWYHNLRAHPEVRLTYAGQTVTYTAHETAGDERERCWRRAADLYSGYPLYERRAAGRHIPVMLLVPYSAPGERHQAGIMRWRAAEDGYADWQMRGVGRAADGTLQFQQATAAAETDPHAPGTYQGRNFYTGGSYFVGEATSPIVTPPFAFTEAVAAWNAGTPPGTWIELQIRVRFDNRWSKWYNLGVWASAGSNIERHSVKQQDDADGRVATDTLVVTNLKPAPTALQVKARLFSATGSLTPVVRNLSVAYSTAASKAPILLEGNPERWNRLLNVPACSQMVYADGGEVWCSPTSTAMVLKYWATDAGPCEPAVRAAVAGVYDWVYDGHGNWPFNVAYAATQGLEGYVARCTTLRQVEDWIAAGVPVIASVAWGEGELTGAPIPSSNGHLVTIVGVDAQGNPIVNDPAAAADSGVQRTYIRSEFETVWLKSSGGIVYVIYPANAAVPGLP
jgi:deazaflavin-dependent oxidoreductase (nitroreductase family)